MDLTREAFYLVVALMWVAILVAKLQKFQINWGVLAFFIFLSNIILILRG